MVPATVMRPIWLLPAAFASVNQRAPSGPAVMPRGLLFAIGTGYSVRVPATVMRPIWFATVSVNQKLPSGPRVIPVGKLSAVLRRNSLIWPAAGPGGLDRK